MDILTILIFPIHEHLFVSFSCSFISVLQFSQYRSFASLVKFIPRYFILFDAVVNVIIFFISLSDSLLVYRNATDFCRLILYPATLLNSLVSSNSFLVVSLGLSVYSIISSGNSDTFTFSHLMWMPFISFSCLLAVARTFSTMLNRSGESGHPCLVPDLRGKAFSFSLLSIVSSGFVIYDLYYVEVCSFYTHFVESFYYKWVLNFVKSFFRHESPKSTSCVANLQNRWSRLEPLEDGGLQEDGFRGENGKLMKQAECWRF